MTTLLGLVSKWSGLTFCAFTFVLSPGLPAQPVHPEPARIGGWQFSKPSGWFAPASGKQNHIFYIGEPIQFTLAANAVSYEVRNYWGDLVTNSAARMSITIPAQPPGWYKLYVYGAQTNATFGDIVGATTFVVFRNDPNFPALPPNGTAKGAAPANDEVLRGLAGIGPQRHSITDASSPNYTTVSFDVALDKQWYLPFDPIRKRDLLIAFPNGTADTNGVREVAREYYHDVKYWEPRNEPNYGSNGGDFVRNELRPFYEAIKGAVPLRRTFVPLLPLTHQWKYHAAGSDLGTAWRETNYNDSAWPSSPALFYHGNQAGSLPVAVGTTLPFTSPQQRTFYFRTRFTVTNTDPHWLWLRASNILDDGAVFYVNGTEVFRQGMGTNVVHYTNFAASSVGTAKWAGPHYWPGTALVQGENLLAVEVHQTSATSSDIAFGLTLDLVTTTISENVTNDLKVLGPGTVGIGPPNGMLGWIEDFLRAGGARYIDGFSFHAYNNVNGDVWLARTSLNALTNLLGRYGANEKEKWQTEQGYFAAVYGAYQPRLQGRWTMVKMMMFEQYGIPKEHNHLWYDRSHGFWDYPTFIENDDGGLNPGAALMRVWSEELFGKTFVRAYDFGPMGNNLYIGNYFSGPSGAVAAFMSAGLIDGPVALDIPGLRSVRVVSAFGVETNLPVNDGRVILPVAELPVYVELPPGTTAEVVIDPLDYAPNLARAPGVIAAASSSASGATITKVNNGILENWYYTQQDGSEPWASDTNFPVWVELRFGATQTVSRVIVFAHPPWQHQSSLLDFELQYLEGANWVTLERVREPTKTFGVFSPSTATTVDSFYSDRWIFDLRFAPVTTSRLRLFVHDATYGGGATAIVREAGGQAGRHRVVLREIEVYGPAFTVSTVPTGVIATPGEDHVALNWNATSGALSYNVYRSASLDGSFSPVGTVAGTTFLDTNAAFSRRYYYAVTAVNPAGESPHSAAVPAIPYRTLIPSGAPWKYFDTGANLGTAWRSREYDDRTWAVGRAKFGYGDGDETTLVSYGPDPNNKHITTYFRHAFIVQDSAVLTNLNVRLLRDDGGAVYLNGVEVFRSNLPGTAINYLTRASSGVGGGDETTNFYATNITASLLVTGTNFVAVEIHQASESNSDLSFDFELRATGYPDCALNFRRENDQLMLAWPAQGQTGVIEAASAISGDWSPVDAKIESSDDECRTAIPILHGQRFFRWRGSSP